MKLRQLQFFTKVVETGSMTRAAEMLNVAQTALGLQIRNLEAHLNVTLFERHSRGVRPTAEGQMLYARALLILHQIAEIEQEISGAGSTDAVIRFGITPSVLRLVGEEFVTTAAADINLQVIENMSFTLIDSLYLGDLDYVLAYEPQAKLGFRRIPLLYENLLHVSAPEYGAQHRSGDTISLHQALCGDLVLVSERDAIWKVVNSAAKRQSIPIRPSYQVQSIQGILSLLRRNVAQSIMPYGSVAEDARQGTLDTRRVVHPQLGITMSLFYAETRDGTKETIAFRKFITRLSSKLLKINPHSRQKQTE